MSQIEPVAGPTLELRLDLYPPVSRKPKNKKVKFEEILKDELKGET